MATEIYPGYTPIKVAQFYGFPTNTGKGQTIAIISLGGPISMTELQEDFDSLNLPNRTDNIKVIDLPGIGDNQNNEGSGETHLDVEVIGSICPDAAINIYRGPNTFTGFAAAVSKAVDDKNTVISISWGATEFPGADSSAMETALKAAKDSKTGITVCIAVGDGGSGNARNVNQAVGAADGLAHIQYPASSPHVLACGGTQLESVNGNTAEYVWNNSANGGGATGGGVSDVFLLPHWQSAHGIDISSANSPHNGGRVIPDVAGLAAYTHGADWKIYEYGQAVPNGGTSAVAPMWSSLVALVNETRQSQGKKNLGWINERLYELAAKGGLFNDVTVGNNRPSANYPGYDAGPGFDACSGWGTPIGAKLAAALVDLP